MKTKSILLGLAVLLTLSFAFPKKSSAKKHENWYGHSKHYYSEPVFYYDPQNGDYRYWSGYHWVDGVALPYTYSWYPIPLADQVELQICMSTPQYYYPYYQMKYSDARIEYGYNNYFGYAPAYVSYYGFAPGYRNYYGPYYGNYYNKKHNHGNHYVIRNPMTTEHVLSDRLKFMAITGQTAFTMRRHSSRPNVFFIFFHRTFLKTIFPAAQMAHLLLPRPTSQPFGKSKRAIFSNAIFNPYESLIILL